MRLASGMPHLFYMQTRYFLLFSHSDLSHPLFW